MSKPTILVLGYKRSGKDTLCEFLRDGYGYDYTTTSLLTAEIVMFPAMKTTHGYASAQECYEDRHNHRELWYKTIQDYNSGDKARLAKEVIKRSQIYAGMRDKAEVEECIKQGVFDYIVWVDKDGCFEDESSCTVDKSLADYVVTNNGSLEQLKEVGAGFVDHLTSGDSDFIGSGSEQYKKYLNVMAGEDSWVDVETAPERTGYYFCYCQDLFNSFIKRLWWDGKHWVETKENPRRIPMYLVTKWENC